jgi:hypothetical protein
MLRPSCALLLLVVPACSLFTSFDGYLSEDAGAKEEKQAEEDSGASQCAAACEAPGLGQCVFGSCVLDCSQGGACGEKVVCPSGVPCRVECGAGACAGGVDCNGASECDVRCGAGACAGPIQCAGRRCTVSCESGACTAGVCCRASSCAITGSLRSACR